MHDPRRAAVSVLRAWAKGRDYADSLIERNAQRQQLSRQDRGLLNAIVLAVLRNRRLLDHWILKLRRGKLDHETRDILRVGLAQLLVLNLPDHAAVFETVELGRAPVRGLLNAVLRRATKQRSSLLAGRDAARPALRYSHPDWLANRWTTAFGESDASALMEWNNQPAPTYARRNPLAGKDACPKRPDDSPPGPELPEDFLLLEGSPPADLLATGAIYIQDPSTRHCVKLLAPQPGERILDACAAPGGKAFLIAATRGGADGLLCTDSNEKRLPRLRENLERLHCGSAETAAHDWTKPAPADWHASFDAIPCLKPGGRLVYSTCSIEEQENQQQIESILTAHPELTLADTRQVLPHRDHFDGAFAARLDL